MAVRKAIALISGRETVMPTTDVLANVGLTYVGTTVRNSSEFTKYFNSGTTDANGRITFNITTDGTATGTAIFSSVVSANAACFSSSTTLANLPNYIVETVTAKTITIRGISSQSGLVILGIAVAQAAFVGAGFDGHIQVWGLP